MATLTDTIDIQPTTPHPDFEPEEEWKTGLRQHIEDTLKPAVEKLKRELNEKLKGLSPPDDTKAHIDYDSAMAGLRRAANEQYRQLLERERQERRWAAGEPVDEKWSEILMKEQQALLDMYKKGATPKTNQPEGTRDEERSQPPPCQPLPSAKVPDRASLPSESIARDRMRRPSNVIAEPIPEHSPPPRTSIEDREPRPYSSGGSWSRRSNGRDRSASIGSPPRPTPEIWKPSSNESASSRPLVHATVGTTKTRRDSSASIGTTSSFPATIPEDASLGTDKDQDSEKLWSGIFRSRQKARKGSAASMDDRVTVSQLFPDFKRDDSAITTSPLTPDSPYGIARHPSHTVSSGRQTVNTRRSFTDESRQPSRWFPPPQTSDPRPIKSKPPFQTDDDGGFPFQASSPSSGPWNTRSSLEEAAPIYPAPSPQDEFRPWKVPPSKPGSIRSRSSINSLRYRPPITHPPPKHYPDGEESISDTEDDSEEDWKQKLEAEFSRRESNAKQMEEEVMKRREEARKKEAELIAKEMDTKRREEELNRKEEEVREEARRKDEELRLKEEELLRKEEEAQRKEDEVLAKEEEVKLKEEEAKRLAEDAEKREEEARLMEEEARRKEEDARQREREAKKRAEDAKKKEEEARRKEEAARIREEDARRKVDEARKREAELRKKEREAKRLEEDAKQKEEEARQIEEEARKKEEELERKEDEMRQLSELVEQKEEDARRKEEEARRKEEEARRKEEDIRKRERDIRRKEDTLKRREKELQDREAALHTREQQEEEDRRVKQEAVDSEAILQATMKEEEIKQKEEELEKREAELERREAEMRANEEERLRQEATDRLAREDEERLAKGKREDEERAREEAERFAKEEGERLAQEETDRLAKVEEERLAKEEADRLAKEDAERQKREQRRMERDAADRRREENVRLEQEREEAKRKEREEKRREPERKQRDGGPRQRGESDRRKRDDDAELKRREEERAEQLEADRREALRLEEEWRQEDIRARREEARRTQDDIRNAEAKLKEVQRKDEARRNESGVSEARFMEEQRKLEAHRQRWKASDDPRRRTESSASYMSTSSTIPSLSESPTKSSAAWTSASSQWTSPNPSIRPTSTSSSQGPIPVRTPTMSTSAGRSSSGSWSVNGAPASGTSPYQTTSISPEEWEKRQQEHARKQQEQFRREQERKERERQARTSKTLSEKEIVALFAEHDRQWTRLKTLDDLGWDSFPWPMFKKPTEPEELTSVAIGAYVLSPHHPTDKSKAARDRVKDHIKKWHPDRFETKLLRKVREEEREKVREGAGLVARNLNEMLTRSNILDVFS